MIVSLIIMAIIVWIEFYAIISKIFKKNKFKNRFLKFMFKSVSLLYLSLCQFNVYVLSESYNQI